MAEKLGVTKRKGKRKRIIRSMRKTKRKKMSSMYLERSYCEKCYCEKFGDNCGCD